MDMNDNYLVAGPITPEMISPILHLPGRNNDTGGHSIFIGQVREDSNETSKVIAIEYSAYEAMVNAEADKILREIYSAFDDVKHIKLMHSTGIVKAGEISLFVLVSAGHRRHAIDACNRLVEMIKERLPVWKKEIYEDSTHSWKNNNLA